MISKSDQGMIVSSHAKNEVEKDRFILKQLVTKDFKIKYRRSFLGVAWSVLNPLLMMIVMAVVFSTIFAQGRNGAVSPELYPLYLIVGNVTFSVIVIDVDVLLLTLDDNRVTIYNLIVEFVDSNNVHADRRGSLRCYIATNHIAAFSQIKQSLHAFSFICKGMFSNDIVFRAALKPAPTISRPQKTVDLINKQNVETSFCGRNDACVGVRAVPVVESAAAIALLDEILSKQAK